MCANGIPNGAGACPTADLHHHLASGRAKSLQLPNLTSAGVSSQLRENLKIRQLCDRCFSRRGRGPNNMEAAAAAKV